MFENRADPHSVRIRTLLVEPLIRTNGSSGLEELDHPRINILLFSVRQLVLLCTTAVPGSPTVPTNLPNQFAHFVIRYRSI